MSEWNKELREMAARSSIETRNIIRERNTKALKKLEEFHIKANKNPADSRFLDNIAIGCPHCEYENSKHHCGNCLWTEVSNDFSPIYCATVKFNGVALNDIGGRQEYIKIRYSAKDVAIEVSNFPTKSSNQKQWKMEYNNCKKFLQGHIDWTKEIPWATKVNDEEYRGGNKK